jgi:hypothetical protein
MIEAEADGVHANHLFGASSSAIVVISQQKGRAGKFAWPVWLIIFRLKLNPWQSAKGSGSGRSDQTKFSRPLSRLSASTFRQRRLKFRKLDR